MFEKIENTRYIGRYGTEYQPGGRFLHVQPTTLRLDRQPYYFSIILLHDIPYSLLSLESFLHSFRRVCVQNTSANFRVHEAIDEHDAAGGKTSSATPVQSCAEFLHTNALPSRASTSRLCPCANKTVLQKLPSFCARSFAKR